MDEAPYALASSLVSSTPIWPLAPVTKKRGVVVAAAAAAEAAAAADDDVEAAAAEAAAEVCVEREENGD